MRQFLFILLTVFGFTVSFAQSDSSKTKTTAYMSLSMSIGHTDPSDAAIDNFSKSSYPSIEVGLMRKNISLGVILGTENCFTSSAVFTLKL